MINFDNYLSTEEAAKILGVTARSVENYYHSGLLAGVTIPTSNGRGIIRIYKDSLENFVLPKRGNPNLKGRKAKEKKSDNDQGYIIYRLPPEN